MSGRLYLVFVPNALSALRFVLAIALPLSPPPVLPYMVAAAGVSDAADGALARRLGVTTVLGDLIDAAADKAFTVGAIVTFARLAKLAGWQVPLLLVGDATVLEARPKSPSRGLFGLASRGREAALHRARKEPAWLVPW